jgi:hypothetical protein
MHYTGTDDRNRRRAAHQISAVRIVANSNGNCAAANLREPQRASQSVRENETVNRA